MSGAVTELLWRDDVRDSDGVAVRELVADTGFFSAAEVEIAIDLVAARQRDGTDAGYRFVLAEDARGLAGFTCFGPIPGTDHRFDLYWIVVRRDRQGQGLGRVLLQRTEAAIRADGGVRLYAETSGRAQYAPTRAFYAACGFAIAAELGDFYAAGDAKVILVKALAP